MSFPEFGGVTVSAGVAEGPSQGAAPRDLTARAHEALRHAKAEGKNRVVAHERTGAHVNAGQSQDRPIDARASVTPNQLPRVMPSGEIRSVAQLRMLQSLSNRLNQIDAA